MSQRGGSLIGQYFNLGYLKDIKVSELEFQG